MVGDNRPPWIGTWVFLREHQVYAGLPSNQCMKWEYQVDAKSASRLRVDGKDVDVFCRLYPRPRPQRWGGDLHAWQGYGIVSSRRGMQPCVCERFITDSLSFISVILFYVHIQSGRSLNQSGYKSEDALQTCSVNALTFKAAFSLELPGGWL
jgi:hypothetical protein